VIPANGAPPEQPLSAALAGSDRLVAIIAIPDLERLLRRQPTAKSSAR